MWVEDFLATLDDTDPHNASFGGSIQGGEGDICEVSFCFCPHSTWLVFLIHGWPREEWEIVQMEGVEDLVSFLVEVGATRHPGATVEFIAVTFKVASIHGALKRLLPPHRKEEVRVDRDRRIAESDRQIEESD